MLQKLCVARLARLYGGDAKCKCDPIWILELRCHIEGNVERIYFGWTKSDVTGGQGVKCTA